MWRKDLKKNNGFTIVELLVAIAIVATLATLVTVTTSKVRARALEVAGLNNLRDLSNATIISTTDRAGRFPVMRNYPWENVIRPDGEPADWMHVVLSENLGIDSSTADLPSIFRNPAVERRRAPAWLVENASHSHYRYNTLTAPGRLPTDPGQAVILFQTAWSDWPAEDMPIQSQGAGLAVAYADGHISNLSHKEYLRLFANGESPTSEFYSKGWE